MIEHTIRKREGGTKAVMLSPLKAIRHHRLECVDYSASEIRNCTSPLCPLYPFRLGKAPGHKGKGNAVNLMEK